MVIKEAMKRLGESSEKIRNTDPQDLANMEIGDEFRQGDLRIIRLPNNWVKKHAGNLIVAEPSAQLAPGITQGSRHILSDIYGVKFFRLKNATPLDGPIVVTPSVRSITHPEHGDAVNLPAGCYAFPGQRTHAEELRRVRD